MPKQGMRLEMLGSVLGRGERWENRPKHSRTFSRVKEEIADTENAGGGPVLTEATKGVATVRVLGLQTQRSV